MTCLAWRVTFMTRFHRKRDRFMICQDMERATLEKVAKMTNREVDGKKFTTKNTISCLSRVQFLGEESKRYPNSFLVLLQDTSNSKVRFVYLKVSKSRFL